MPSSYPDPEQTIQALHMKLHEVNRNLQNLKELGPLLPPAARNQALQALAEDLRSLLQELGLSEKEEA